MIKTTKQDNFDNLLNKLGISLNIDNKVLKLRDNGLLLSDEQIEILTRHNINYKEYNNLSSLIFKIEEYIQNVQSYMEISDIDELSKQLSEQNYYNNTNK
ncbi:MAG: hypothetical protein J6D28_03075 [Bacilli bacterium]|nr:hypothetical protein [Bacilli bacterium]